MRIFSIIGFCLFGLVSQTTGSKHVSLERDDDTEHGSFNTMRALQSSPRAHSEEVLPQGTFPPPFFEVVRQYVDSNWSPEDTLPSETQVCPLDDAGQADDPKQVDYKYFDDVLRLVTEGDHTFFERESRMTGEEGETAETIGLCTTAYLSYQKIKDRMAAFPGLQVDNAAYRTNDLGYFRMNRRSFQFCKALGLPDSCAKMSLAMSNEDHMMLRPLLDELFGDGRVPGMDTSFSTDGLRWTKKDLLSSAKEFLKDKKTLSVITDATSFLNKELHRQILGIDLSEEELQQSVFLQNALLIDFLPAADDTLPKDFIQGINGAKLKFVEFYEAKLRELIDSDSISTSLPTDDDITKGAINILDAFVYGGGPSVPSTIRSALAAYYAGLNDNDFDITDPEDLSLHVLETLRVYPPAIGFFYTDAKTGQKHVPMVGYHGYDRSVYGIDADEFKIRGDTEYYHKLSLNWAESALPVNGQPHSNHMCPARSLSYNLIMAFLEALDASEWCVDPSTPIVRQTSPTFWSDFSLIKGACPKTVSPTGSPTVDVASHRSHSIAFLCICICICIFII